MKSLLISVLLCLLAAPLIAAPIYRVPLIHTTVYTKYKTWAYFYQNSQTEPTLANVDTGSPSVLAVGNADICPSCGGDYRLNVGTESLGKAYRLGMLGGGTVNVFPTTVSLQNTPKFKLNAGVITSANRGDMLHPIVGMDPEKLVHGQIVSFMRNIVRTNHVPYNFGLLLCPLNGELDLGGVPAFVNHSSGVSAPFNKTLHRFSVPPASLSVTVNGNTEPLGNFPPLSRKSHYVFDSGTPVWVIDSTLYSQMARVLIRYSRQHQLGIPARFWENLRPYSKRGIALSQNIINQFYTMPVFNIVFANGTTIHVHADTYLRPIDSGNYIFAINSSNNGTEIFGDTVIMNYYLNYDWSKGVMTFYSNQGLCSPSNLVAINPPSIY